MSLLEINSVTRRFGGLAAVDDVSATVEKGELIGLIGPNGAGKTTLFNLISGFTPLTSGSIAFKGTRISGRKPHAIARMGMSRTFQNLRIFPNMSVFDNTSVGATGIVGQPAWNTIVGSGARAETISKRSWEALERVQLTGVAHELAANLSYGRRKYLEIARALAMQPELLILDEPAAGLNDSETAELAAFIRELSGDGITIMLVEHDMNLVLGICQRIVVLASGRKIADGAAEDVRRDPLVLEAYLGADDE